MAFQKILISSAFITLMFYTINSISAKPPTKIVGGQYTSIEKFPSMVSIRNGHNHDCGGSLISNKHVLTAAHCIVLSWKKFTNVEERKFINVTTLAMGTSSSEGNSNLHRIENIRIHPGYNGSSNGYNNDIAILTLTESVIPTETCKPIALPLENIQPGKTGHLVGWGTNSSFTSFTSTILKETEATTYDMDVCRNHENYKGDHFHDSQICINNVDNTGFCNGDSGGPFIVDGRIVGIISNSYACGEGIPQILTKVYDYLDWIKKIVDK